MPHRNKLSALGTQPLLDYMVQPNPNPIQISTESGDPNMAALTIIVSNGQEDDVYCNKIEFMFYIGDPLYPDASYLTDTGKGIKAAGETSDQWQISHENEGVFTATPKKPSAQEIGSQGLTFKIHNIKVSKLVGTFAFTIIEHSSTTASDEEYPSKKVELKIAKFPATFEFEDLNAKPHRIDPGGNITLYWKGSEDAIYTLEWNDRKEDVTHVRSFTVRNLMQSTTFYIIASHQFEGETVEIEKSVSVIVRRVEILSFTANPDIPIDSGEKVTLKWETSNADYCTLEPPIDPQKPEQRLKSNDNIAIYPNIKQPTFQLTAHNEKTGTSDSRSLRFYFKSVTIDSFTIIPNTFIKTGESVKLEWQVKNALSCSINHGIGIVTNQGTEEARPTKKTTYILKAKGVDSLAKEEKTVSIVPILMDTMGADIDIKNMIIEPDDGSRIYTLSDSSTAITVIDPLKMKVETKITTGKALTAIAFKSDGSKFYVTDISSNSVLVIEEVSFGKYRIVKTIAVGKEPRTIAMHPDDSKAYVLNRKSGEVSVIDTETDTVVAIVELGQIDSPNAPIALNTDGSKLYIVRGFISVIDTTNNAHLGDRVATLDFVGPSHVLQDRISIKPDGSRYYVVALGSSSWVIYVMDNESQREAVASVDCGGCPSALAFNQNGTMLYAVISNCNHVSVIDTERNIEITRIRVGDRPMSLALHPAGNLIFVGNANSHDISVIETATNTVLATISLRKGNKALALAFKPDGSRLYAAGSGVLSVINTSQI